MAIETSERIAVELRSSAIVMRDEQILLVLHTRRDMSYWVLPGGHPLENEVASAAVEREVMEETGLRIEAGRVQFVWEGIDPREGRRLIEVVFSSELLDRRAEPISRSQLELPRFVPIEELGQIPLYPPVAGNLRGAWRAGFADSAPYLGNVWRSMRSDARL
jgi:8-oxo-dGTP diphosphatase